MNRLIYQVYLGNKSQLYDTCIESVKNYCLKFNIKHIVQDKPILKIVPDLERNQRNVGNWNELGYLPIFEKENAFDLLEQFDQIAIIDSDIYIKPDAPNIFNELTQDFQFGAVVERDLPINDKYANKIKKYSQSAFGDLKDVDWKWNDLGAEFYNMGLMVINKSFLSYLGGDSAREFINRKEFKDFVDGIGYYKWSTDQILLNYFIKKQGLKIKNLDWRFNSLYSALKPNYIKNSYFVHFFLKDKLPGKGENVKELIKLI